ncbi:MAG: outer membrane lipoprotein-sorting protein [Roseovarius sp.]|nr:outer membrane lipoprotein-sorting protein [Roseovarius sp.]MCY4291590.1 outer membrane lipoprotein-sorting protein [Roseovarius sp.]MCY4316556.1 outer membrane lipoprotein-sorting protein [Roseovarius sp.]
MTKSRAKTILSAFLLALAFASKALTADGTALLEKADNIRGPGPNFSFVSEIQPPEGSPVEVSVSVRENTKGLVRYTRPAKLAGRTILYLDQNMWIYIPGTGRALRISPQQRLHGAVSHADIARTAYSSDYVVEKTKVAGNGYILELKARTRSVAYHRINLTVDKSGAPQVAVFHARSGDRKLKSAYFEGYRNVLGMKRPTRLRIVDHLDGDAVTIMIYREFEDSTAPAAWFQPNQLRRL